MSMPKLSDVLNELHGYERVAFRIALQRDPKGGWQLHTLVVDAIPESLIRDEVSFQQRYNLAKFVHSYSSAVFIAGVEESSQVISWFDAAHDFSIPALSGPGTSTRVYTTRMPTLQEQPSWQTYFYRTVKNDSLDLMRWPHTTYSFSPTPFVTEQQDDTRLIPAGGRGSRTFSNFKEALATLIYGEKDREQAQRRIHSAATFVRIVREQPFLADIRQVDPRSLSVQIDGLNLADTFIQLDVANSDMVEIAVDAPGTYRLEVATDLPQSGRLSLIQSGELLDEEEWNSIYAPFPGAPTSTMRRPLVPFSPEMLNNRSEIRLLENLGEIAGISAETPDDPVEDVPLAIRESLTKFRADHPDSRKTGFIMMQFGKTKAHNQIAQTIKKVLAARGLEAVRADDKKYHDNTYENIETYIHGCGFGIAVFERLERNEFNPNVAFEVGYMKAMRKHVCLLKDTTLTALQTDLLGKLYCPFDPQQIQRTMKPELESWLRDEDLLNTNR